MSPRLMLQGKSRLFATPTPLSVSGKGGERGGSFYEIVESVLYSRKLETKPGINEFFRDDPLPI